MSYFGKLLWFGLSIALICVLPSTLEAQSLSFLKMLPAAPPAWNSTAVASDASGIYTAEGENVLHKYDRDGAEIWSLRFENLRLIRALATSGAGLYVGGATYNNVVPGPSGSSAAESYVRLYDERGKEIWTRQFGFTGEAFNLSYVSSVAADSSGVYLAGTYYSGAYLRKYDNQGAELWTRRFSGSYWYRPLPLAAGPPGIFFSGIGEKGLFLRRYDPAGTELWTIEVNGEYLTGIANTATDVYVTGVGASGPFLSRYDTLGNRIWTRTSIAGWIKQLAVDADGIYLAGVTDRALAGQCAAGSSDAFAKRFDSNGNEVWTRQFGTQYLEDVTGIVVDAGNVFVAGGEFVGSVTFPAKLVDHAFLAKLEKASVAASPSDTRIRNECVVNSASSVGGAVSPGEIVTITGTTIGPPQAVLASIGKDRPAGTTLAETRVLFGGIPAPLLSASSAEVRAIVPYEVAGQSSVGIQVEYRGVQSNAVTVPVLKAHPGIFNIDSSGWGAVWNEDGTLNSPANPARRGSTVATYGTGGGELDAAIADGQVVASPLPRLKSPVLVAFPETEETDYYVPAVEAVYAGTVAGFVSGLVQVNMKVPESLPAGNWSLQLRFGSRSEAETASLQIAVR